MELKLQVLLLCEMFGPSLNRTFYGIETYLFVHLLFSVRVLIVPFMELKQGSVIVKRKFIKS